MKFYEEGCERVDGNLDVVMISKKIEYMNETLNRSLMTLKMKQSIMKSNHLTLDVDHSIQLVENLVDFKNLDPLAIETEREEVDEKQQPVSINLTNIP